MAGIAQYANDTGDRACVCNRATKFGDRPQILKEVASGFEHIITVEDGLISGGFGSAVLEYFASEGWPKSIVRLGVPDRFIEQGTQQELYHECGFDAEGICQAVRNILM